METGSTLLSSRLIHQIQFYFPKGPAVPEVVPTRLVRDIQRVPEGATGLRFKSIIENVVKLSNGNTQVLRSEPFDETDVLVIKKVGAPDPQNSLEPQEVHSNLRERIGIYLVKKLPPKRHL